VIVHGFASQKSGLQFEWAWQHCDKSLAVRAAIGNEEARSLKRKRATRGQLCILHSLVTKCASEICGTNELTLYFFDLQHKAMFEKINFASGKALPKNIRVELVESVQDMPFFQDKGNKSKKNIASTLQSSPPPSPTTKQTPSIPARPPDCMYCRFPIAKEKGMQCSLCGEKMHEICADIYLEEKCKACPSCKAPFECDDVNDGWLDNIRSGNRTAGRRLDLPNKMTDEVSSDDDHVDDNHDDDQSFSSSSTFPVGLGGSEEEDTDQHTIVIEDDEEDDNSFPVSSNIPLSSPLNTRKFQNMSLSSPSPPPRWPFADASVFVNETGITPRLANTKLPLQDRSPMSLSPLAAQDKNRSIICLDLSSDDDSTNNVDSSFRASSINCGNDNPNADQCKQPPEIIDICSP
jgi:hypothetical protein